MPTDRPRSFPRNRSAEDLAELFLELEALSRSFYWETDRDGLLTCVSPTIREILGYDPEEIAGKKTFYDLFPADRREAGRAEALAVFARKESFTDYENEILAKDGSLLAVSTNGTPVLDGDGTLLGYRGTDADITERKTLEEELDYERRFLSRVLETTPAAVTVVDRDGRIEFANDSARNVLSISLSEASDRTYDDPAWKIEAVEGGPFPEDRLPFARVLRTGEPVEDVRQAIHWPDGRRRILSVSGAPLEASGDRVDKAIFSIADVAAGTEAKTRLTEARRLAENASRAKSRFLSRMSHELRTPLNGILGMTEILGDTSDPAEREEAVETIRSCGRELLALVEELLAVADKNPFEGLAEGEPKSPSEILAAVEDRFQVRAETEGKDFTVEGGEFSDGTLLPAQPIFVVLGHLLDNSFKFTGPGDRISLTVVRAPAEAEPGTVRFAVRDSGPGIPPSCRETVFNEFFQVDESATRRHGGAGLGLSLARKTAKSLGGSLRLAPLDASTAGTEVWFNVPPAKTRTEGDGPAGGPDRKPALPSESPRILLVEDDPTNRIVATRILEKSGCSVRQARDGEEALEQLYRRSFDLVLMDIRMPKLDGWEVVRRFRADPGEANPPDLPIIALTALAMEKDRAESLAAGMDDYLAKPLTSDALRRKVLGATRPGPPDDGSPR